MSCRLSAYVQIFNSSLEIAQLVIGFTTSVTQNGLASGSSIDFTGAGISSSMIISAIETSLENKMMLVVQVHGLLSGASNSSRKWRS